MKQIITLLVILMTSTHGVLACDACGCSGSLGNMGLGVQVQGNRTSFSMLHSYKHYSTFYKGLYGRPDSYSDEYYFKSEFAGSIRLSPRFQARFNVPLTYNLQRSEELGNTTLSSLGDSQLGLHYFVVDSMFKNGMIARWSVGVGAKLPTGKFVNPSNEKLMLYPGTGTTDVSLTSSFAMRFNKFGLSNESSYFIRSSNKYGYHPGNSFFSQLLGIFIVNKFSIGTGISIATNANAKLNGNNYEHTNAQAAIVQNATIISYSLNSWSFQAGINIPIYQKLGEEQSTQKEAFSFGVYYLLNKTK